MLRVGAGSGYVSRMPLYAELPTKRTVQVVGDVVFLLWIAVWLRVGRWVQELVERLAGAGRSVEGAGGRLRDAGDAVAERAGDLPVVGDRLRAPFEAVGRSGTSLAEAGRAQQDAVADLALLLGVVVGLAPVVWLVARYVPTRLRWMREAAAARRLRGASGDLEVFALRALVNRPLHELRRATADPAAAYRNGDYGPLAELELAALGLAPEPLLNDRTRVP